MLKGQSNVSRTAVICVSPQWAGKRRFIRSLDDGFDTPEGAYKLVHGDDLLGSALPHRNPLSLWTGKERDIPWWLSPQNGLFQKQMADVTMLLAPPGAITFTSVAPAALVGAFHRSSVPHRIVMVGVLPPTAEHERYVAEARATLQTRHPACDGSVLAAATGLPSIGRRRANLLRCAWNNDWPVFPSFESMVFLSQL